MYVYNITYKNPTFEHLFMRFVTRHDTFVSTTFQLDKTTMIIINQGLIFE